MMLQNKRQSGSALLLVILITAVMATVMTVMMAQNNYHMKLASLLKNNTKTSLALYTTQADIIFDLMSSQTHIVGPKYQKEVLSQSTPFDNFVGVDFKYKKHKVSIQDKSGLVSLFPLDEAKLSTLFSKSGVSREELFIVIDRIKDWMDDDNLIRLSGAEKGNYTETPYLPTNVNIQQVEELYYILDNNRELYLKVKPYLGLYVTGGLNPSYVPAELSTIMYGKALNSDIVSTSSESGESIGGDGSTSYPSGKLLISINPIQDEVNIKRTFEVVRGLGTFKPFYIINEKTE